MDKFEIVALHSACVFFFFRQFPFTPVIETTDPNQSIEPGSTNIVECDVSEWASPLSPWIMVWTKSRRTIRHVVATSEVEIAYLLAGLVGNPDLIGYTQIRSNH